MNIFSTTDKEGYEIPTFCIFNNPYPIFEPDAELYNVQILYKPKSAQEIATNFKKFILTNIK